MNRARLVYAAAVSAMVGWGLLAPQPAQAQFLSSLIVTVTSPADGSTVSGTVPVTASVSIIGALTVAGVQFKLDGANLGAEDTSAPYSVSWNTATASNGSHTLTAVARDSLGALWTSDPVTVTVSNGPPPDTTAPSVPTGLTATVVSSSQINLSWTGSTDNVGVTGYRIFRGGTQFATTSTTSYADTGLSASTTYSYNVAAFDAAGNVSAQSSPASATTPAPPDTTPPTVSITSPASGAIVGATISVTASASDNVGVVGVQFLLDGSNAVAEVTAAPYLAPWDTTTASNGSHILTAVARDAAGNRTTSAPVTVAVANPSPTVLENQQPGSGNWRMWLRGIAPADDVNQQIKGYASATSLNKGESITFYVTVNPAQQYTMDVYRMGYYQGLGGRLMQSIGPLQGVAQPACPADASTGLIECNWTASYTLTVPTSWTSGVFMVQLTNAQGSQNYITFVVRDDARVADIMFQQAVATYQAYNNYPDDSATGKSIYDFNSYGASTVAGTGTKRAVKVSWNRPYADRGAGQFFQWEFYFIRWLEQSGYDVKYSTDVDTHENSARLLQSKAFLSIGHNEYWSKAMYDGVQQARDAGVHLGFFGADAVFWQVRFEPSPLTGAVDRVMVGYKDRTIDPVQGPTTTILWRDPFLNRPEQQLIGVQFSGSIDISGPFPPYVVKNSSSWVYAGTGLADGDSIPKIVGYEMDSSMSNFPLPASVAGTYQVLSQSPYTDPYSGPMTANSSIYQAPSGAWVFGAGTTNWSWGLSDDGDGYMDPRIQRITANVLNRFGVYPPP